VKEDVFEIRLAGIVGYDETVALARVEPLDATTDSHRLRLRIHAIQIVTHRIAPHVRKPGGQVTITRIFDVLSGETKFSLEKGIGESP
jgi:hypothetical protein